MSWSGFLKVVLGVLLAIALLAGGGVVAARIMIARLSEPPPKPMYPNDNPTPPKPAAKPASTTAKADKPDKPDKPAAKPLPSGAYPARVTQSIGLIVRDAPGDGAQVGGVDYNDRVIVLETSPDGAWQRIRIGNDREGWIRAGNVEQITP